MRPVAALVFLAFLVVGCGKSEPTYLGRPFSTWMTLSNDRDPETAKNARLALMHFGDYRASEVVAQLLPHADEGRDDFILRYGSDHDKEFVRQEQRLFQEAADTIAKEEAKLAAEKPRRDRIEELRTGLNQTQNMNDYDAILEMSPPPIELLPDVEGLLGKGMNAKGQLAGVAIERLRQIREKLVAARPQER